MTTTYCSGRLFYDADSHIMETPDWLSRHVEPGYREQIPPMDFSLIGTLGDAVRGLDGDGRHADEEVVRQSGDIMGSAKGYGAVGSSNPAERSRALDLIGVERQLIFAGLSVTQFLYQKDLDVKYAGARAHNRAMAEFCADDPRMMGVAIVPLHDPDRAVAEADLALELGCAAVWVRAQPDGDRSPAHPDLQPFWALLEDRCAPFIIHVGAQQQQIRAQYMNNGRPVPKDFLGGGEVIRAKDYMTYHHVAEAWLSCLVLDGVLDRHPRLKGAAIELGSSWVPGWLQRLENVVTGWGRSEPQLVRYERSPKQQALDQLTFTNLPFEDVGAIIRASSPDLYMFGTDFPHVEGSRDPLGKMTATMDGLPDDVFEKFLAGNFAKMMGLPVEA